MYGPAQPETITKLSRGATERAKRGRDDAFAEIKHLNQRMRTILETDPAETASHLHGTLPTLECMAALKGATWKRDVDLTTLRGLYTVDATITAVDLVNAHFSRLREPRIATFSIPRGYFNRILASILVRPAANGGLIRATVAIPVLCEIRAGVRIQLALPATYDQEGGAQLIKITKAELVECAVVPRMEAPQPPEDAETPQPPEDAEVPQPPDEEAEVPQPPDDADVPQPPEDAEVPQPPDDADVPQSSEDEADDPQSVHTLYLARPPTMTNMSLQEFATARLIALFKNPTPPTSL
ncbi:hypothetical protein B484DRAFT_407906 [Ochromonadaceae sp. CCMP2298]|nr:hypothetical protein B484DRAFT_407906 [Ochromonadaceae sp. CCMP2298]